MKQGIYNIESGIELENDAHVLVLPVYLLVSFFLFFFFESFDRDDGMPLDVANIEISIAASISLRIPPLFRIHISTLYIFIYPW